MRTKKKFLWISKMFNKNAVHHVIVAMTIMSLLRVLVCLIFAGFWCLATGVSNTVTGVSNTVTGVHVHTRATASSMGASKFGHSVKTHDNVYSSTRYGGVESHFNSYHFSIGDTSYEMPQLQSTTLSLGDIRAAMSLRYPKSISPDGHCYLSVNQKELVEFGHGHGSAGKQQHCFGLLSPGEGKSECYVIPTIALRGRANF